MVLLWVCVQNFRPKPNKCKLNSPSVRTAGSFSHPCSPACFASPEQLNRAKTKHSMKTLTVNLIKERGEKPKRRGRGQEEDNKRKMKKKEIEGRRARVRGKEVREREEGTWDKKRGPKRKKSRKKETERKKAKRKIKERKREEKD